MTISEFTRKSSDAEPVRRFEVFTGSGRRRDWSPEEKARIVAESYGTDETVCAVARRYALSPQQLFTWRRATRKLLDFAGPSPPLFVPAVVPAPDKPSSKPIRRKPSRKAAGTGKGSGASIELEIDGVLVRIGRGAEAKTVAAVIGALKATS